jgi:hypothetical protein
LAATRHFLPRVEQFDERLLPSAASGMAASVPAQPPSPAVVVHPTHAPSLTLLGQITGAWSTVPTAPNAGQVQKLSASAAVSPLGTVQVDGTLSTPGHVVHGKATATVVFAAALGSVTLQFTGPSQPGLSPPPARFSYTITGGTGAYAGDTGRGAASFQETLSSVGVHTFTLTFRPTVPPPLIGQISGTWYTPPLIYIPEVRPLQLFGSGSVSPLGTVEVAGTLTTILWSPGVRAVGTIVLSNVQGSITLQLAGVSTRASWQPPSSFSYRITSATGAFAGETGLGTASLQETFSPLLLDSFTLTFHPAP